MLLKLITADICTLRLDAIVNAANPHLLGGGGVDGAIHRAAGPELLDACRALPEIAPGIRCPTGEARITPGFDLPARHVIHTVGPVWHGGTEGEPALLEKCYRHSLRLLRERGLQTIAFPAISCGVYGYPAAKAAALAVAVLLDELAHPPVASDGAADDVIVTLCCFSDAMRSIIQQALTSASDGS